MNARCLFCDTPSNVAWVFVAGPDGGACDACIANLDAVVSMASPDAAPSPDLFGPCRFCGATGGEARLIVGNAAHDGRAPVICHGCVALAAGVAGSRVDYDDPWYRPLREEGAGGVRGWTDEDAAPLIAAASARMDEVDAWAAERMASLQAKGLPTDGDVPVVVRRKAIGDLLRRMAIERDLAIPVGTARAVGEALLARA